MIAEINNYNQFISAYERISHNLEIFMSGVEGYIARHPDLNVPGSEVVHSFKSRLKDKSHLAEKLQRKINRGDNITIDNFFRKITDLAGVRVLHLFQEDFGKIDQVIRQRIKDGDWFLIERPKAYTWDPEAANYFSNFDLAVAQKSSAYTSVHYVISPRPDAEVCCEVQVRTLFEEIWGEVDHRINYPQQSSSIACREQLLVLSKIVGAGSRLLDSLQRVHHDHSQKSILGE